ncbi:MAG: hypothetical protein JNG84_03590 [Archangium sp.]|nr:hypothetical protein [Archangium sp.]
MACYACTSHDDCLNGRTCNQGLCVDPPPDDGGPWIDLPDAGPDITPYRELLGDRLFADFNTAYMITEDDRSPPSMGADAGRALRVRDGSGFGRHLHVSNIPQLQPTMARRSINEGPLRTVVRFGPGSWADLGVDYRRTGLVEGGYLLVFRVDPSRMDVWSPATATDLIFVNNIGPGNNGSGVGSIWLSQTDTGIILTGGQYISLTRGDLIELADWAVLAVKYDAQGQHVTLNGVTLASFASSLEGQPEQNRIRIRQNGTTDETFDLARFIIWTGSVTNDELTQLTRTAIDEYDLR